MENPTARQFYTIWTAEVAAARISGNEMRLRRALAWQARAAAVLDRQVERRLAHSE